MDTHTAYDYQHLNSFDSQTPELRQAALTSPESCSLEGRLSHGETLGVSSPLIGPLNLGPYIQTCQPVESYGVGTGSLHDPPLRWLSLSDADLDL